MGLRVYEMDLNHLRYYHLIFGNSHMVQYHCCGVVCTQFAQLRAVVRGLGYCSFYSCCVSLFSLWSFIFGRPLIYSKRYCAGSDPAPTPNKTFLVNLFAAALTCQLRTPKSSSAGTQPTKSYPQAREWTCGVCSWFCWVALRVSFTV